MRKSFYGALWCKRTAPGFYFSTNPIHWEVCCWGECGGYTGPRSEREVGWGVGGEGGGGGGGVVKWPEFTNPMVEVRKQVEPSWNLPTGEQSQRTQASIQSSAGRD
jgi:hypothetical protein